MKVNFNVTNKGRMSLQEFHEVVAKKFNFKLKVIKCCQYFFYLIPTYRQDIFINGYLY